MTAQIHGCPQVDFPATQQPAQLTLDVRQAKEPDVCVGPKFNQDVDIAGFGKTIGKKRAERASLRIPLRWHTLAISASLISMCVTVMLSSAWLTPPAVVPWCWRRQSGRGLQLDS